jgi:hypothetical protein
MIKRNVMKPLRAVFNVLKMLKEEGELGGTRSEAVNVVAISEAVNVVAISEQVPTALI